MIKVIIPLDKDFDYEINKHLFNKANQTLKEKMPFDELIKCYQFFSFYDGDEYLGFIYFFYKDDKLYVATASVPKRYKKTLECFKQALTYYDCDIYAQTTQRHVKLAALKVGFKKISDNLYKYERI